MNKTASTTGLHLPTTLMWWASSSTGCLGCGLLLRTPVTSTALPNVSDLRMKSKYTEIKMKLKTLYSTYIGISHSIGLWINMSSFFSCLHQALTDHSTLKKQQSAVAADNCHQWHGGRDLPSELWQTEPIPTSKRKLGIYCIKLSLFYLGYWTANTVYVYKGDYSWMEWNAYNYSIY